MDLRIIQAVRRLLPPLENAIKWRTSTAEQLVDLTEANVDTALSTYQINPGTPCVAAPLFGSLSGTLLETLPVTCHEWGESYLSLYPGVLRQGQGL
jgi:hypothetical protein